MTFGIKSITVNGYPISIYQEKFDNGYHVAVYSPYGRTESDLYYADLSKAKARFNALVRKYKNETEYIRNHPEEAENSDIVTANMSGDDGLKSSKVTASCPYSFSDVKESVLLSIMEVVDSRLNQLQRQCGIDSGDTAYEVELQQAEENLAEVVAMIFEEQVESYGETGSELPSIYSSKRSGTGMKITKRKIVANKKSVKAATSGKIPYDLVSMLVILRDWANTDDSYINKEHEDLVGIADFLYNNGSSMVEYLQPEAKAVYDKYGKKFFDMVLDDAAAIDSQISSSNVKDLIADYNDRAEAFEGGVNASCSKKSVKASKVDGDDMTLTFITPDLSAASMVAEKAWEIGGFGSTWSEHSWVYIDVPATQSIDNIEELIDYAQNNGVYLNTKSANELDRWLGLVDAACGKKSVKAGYAPGEILWVLDEDNTWKTWGSAGPRIKSMSDAELLESLNSQGNNYIDVLITKNGENPDDYGRTEAIKGPFVRASAKKSVKCNDGIAPDDYDSVEDLVPEAYALSGGEDDDMLEYVDDYIATEGYPATVNFVTYNTPNDWSVDVSKYGDNVVSDFIWYLEEVAPELSDKFFDYPTYEDDNMRDAFKGTKYQEGGKYATYYGDNALWANDYEFQFYPTQNQWFAPQIEFDTDELKLIGFTDDEVDKLMQIYEDYKAAWIENCKYINGHIAEFLAELGSEI